MWSFKRKKTDQKARLSGFQCPHCKGTHTGVINNQDNNQIDYIKIWRGHRFVNCRCLDCGRDFYSQEPSEGLTEDIFITDAIINEDDLHAAEDEVKRQTNEDDDRTCR